MSKQVVRVDKQMITEKTWAEFRKTGLFFLVNQLLHVFGWSIVFNYQDGEITQVFPARVKHRGFSEKDQDEQHLKIANYLAENGQILKEEVEGGSHE